MMKNSLNEQAAVAMAVARPFLSCSQFTVMLKATRGEEGSFFQQKFVDMARTISTMPVTYQQEGKGDQAIVYLHYFLNGSDWYIIEKDMDGGICQAYGYAVLNGDTLMAECGYISIQELVRNGVELDLHFTPCPLSEIKGK